MITYEIKYYVDDLGHSPFLEWHDSLKDSVTKQVIDARIMRVAAGNLGDCKPLGDGLRELKIMFKAGYRVYFTIKKNTIVVLLCAGKKAEQKRDIVKARNLLKMLEREYE